MKELLQDAKIQSSGIKAYVVSCSCRLHLVNHCLGLSFHSSFVSAYNDCVIRKYVLIAVVVSADKSEDVKRKVTGLYNHF